MSELYEAKGYGDTLIGFGISLAVLVIKGGAVVPSGEAHRK